MKWLPVSLGFVLFVIIIGGLGYVLNKNLKMAPWAATADDGRLYSHLKNTTRFGGSPEQVRRSVWRAVHLDEVAAPPPQKGWQAELNSMLKPSASPDCVVVLPSEREEALAWALPGAYWAMYAGCPVVFASVDTLDEQAQAALRKYKVPAFVLAPPALVSANVLQQIKSIVPTQRLSGDTLFEHAVKLAEYRNENVEFGWGRKHQAREGYFDFVVTTPAEAEAALAALPLAGSNMAPLLYAYNDGSVSAELDRYLWAQRADWFVTPAEGPFRHIWVIGDQISYAAQARLDFALEKGPYESFGPAALGPLEGLLIVLIALGIAGALFVFIHGFRFLPAVPLPMRIAWAFTAMLVPILGVILYFAAYRRPHLAPGEMPPTFLRPPSIQSAAATVMGFGYGAPLMIVIGYGFVFFGLPLWFGDWADGWEFLFGAGMVWMMIAMWAGAILIAWLAAQWPMARMRMPKMPRWKLARKTLLTTVLSMSAVSLGMMTVAWWMQMSRLRMMPKEDDILWFGAMWVASLIGFLLAWPLNYPMIRKELKRGTA